MMRHTILFLASNSPGAAQRPLDAEARAIRLELRRSGFPDHFVFETRGVVERLDLLRDLREIKPTIVHFSGHGSEHGLLLASAPDASGTSRPVGPEVVAEVFAASGAPLKLVVLSACYSEATARALLAQVDYVVGNSGALHDGAAHSFAVGFYGGLGEHESIARAYRQGCAAISLAGLSDAARPRLLVRDGADADDAVFATEASVSDHPCPYPGMRPYAANDATGFFGRDAEVTELLDRLRAGEREIYVIGPSGSGKSSLVAAGLLPQLARGATGLGSYIVRSMRPGERPAARLRELLEATGATWSPPDAIAALLSHRGPNASLLIVVDQLEELFALASTAERAEFSSALQALRSQPRCVMICTLRADFFGAFMESALWTDRDTPLWTDRRSRISYLEVSPLTGGALREAIVRPAQALEVEVEPALIDQLLDDAAHEPGILPLLQETLLQLWERRQGLGLTLAGYRALGDGGRSGLAVALSRRADATLHALSQAQLAIAMRILLRLVSFGEDRANTRRQQVRSTLRAAGDDVAEFTRVLETLIAHRLVTIDDQDGSDAPSDPCVDLAHEVMITAWPMLAGWVQAHSADEARRRELDAKAAIWTKHGRRGRGLLDAIELAEAVAWQRTELARALGESAEVAALIAASTRHLARQTMTRRIAVLSLVAALAVVVLVVSRSAITARREADKSKLLLVRSREDTGRRLLLDGHAEQAVPYLLFARENGEDSEPLRMLFRMAARLLPVVPPLEHRGSVLCAAFSPDGQRVLTASDDHSARIWNAATGAQLARIQHGHWLTRAVFSADGTRVATASKDHTARIWNAATGEPITGPLPHDEVVGDVAFSPDGSRVITASTPQDSRMTVRLWDAVTGAPLGEPRTFIDVASVAFPSAGPRVVTTNLGDAVVRDGAAGTVIGTVGGHKGSVNVAVLSPDGARLATASQDGTARVWDLVTGKPITEPLAHPDGVTQVAFSRDGLRVATASEDHAAYVWDSRTGARLAGPLPHRDSVTSVVLSRDGTRVVTTSADHTAWVWDVATSTLIAGPFEHPQAVRDVAFSPDGTRVVTAGLDHAARIWDATPALRAISPSYPGALAHSSFDSSCTRLLIASTSGAGIGNTAGGTVSIWDVRTGALVAGPLAHDGGFAAVSRDGRRIVTTSADGTAQVWDTATGRPITERLPHSRPVERAAFSADGARIVTVSGNTARVWDTASSRLVAILLHQDRVTAVAFSPDGRRIATASNDHTAQIWDAAGGGPVTRALRHNEEVNSVAFSADGTRVVTASNDDSARVWDATTGEPVGDPCWHQGSVLHATFSPDGSRIATASADQSARIWDARTGQALSSPLSHMDIVNAAEFSPDGTRLATASKDRTILVWDVTMGVPLTSPLRHRDSVLGVAFCPDGDRIVTTVEGNAAQLWDVAPDRGTFEQWTETARRSAFSLVDGVLARRPPSPD